jgi:catechol 2,3-dioxygenase-like lactoylglutathione lyase family enzyme
MRKFDHLTIPVRNWKTSRDWYVDILGLTVEFEIPDAKTAAIRDEHDFTIFFAEGPVPDNPGAIALTFQVDDVRAVFGSLSGRGVAFRHAPQKVFWGFGAELADPDGYAVRLWDERSMKAGG